MLSILLAAFGCAGEKRSESGEGGGTGRAMGGSSAGGSVTGGAGSSSGGAPGGGAATSGAAGSGGDLSGGGLGTSGAGGGSGAGAPSGGSGGGSATGIRIDGRRIVVDGQPYHVRGVCWNPVPRGATHPAGLDYEGLAPVDVPLMEAAGINTVRTYEPLLDRAVLDRLWAAGIRVLDTVYPYGGDPASVVSARVEAVRDHPAILGWVLGNEWNYNGLYVDLSHAESLARVNEAAALVKAADSSRPVVTVYGELPSAETVAAMPDIDVWGINAYRGIGFGDLLTVWAGRSEKPMFLAEYGADAYNTLTGSYDPESQATAVRALTEELLAASSALTPDGVTLGGTLFEWSDEWWKAGNPDVQDVGGAAPGGGPYPDQTFNEEFWGVVDVERATRPAYDELRALYRP